MKRALNYLPLIILILMYVFGLLFRKFWWCDIPVADGQAYGIGDVFEFVIGISVYILCAIVFVQAMFLFLWKRFKNVRLAFFLLVVSVFTSLSFIKIHGWIDVICTQGK